MRMKMRTINKRGLLSFLLTLIMIIGVLPLSAPTVSAEDDTVEVSTWDELKRALEYTTNCSVVKVVADIETKGLNGHTGLHQDNIIFMTMEMDKVLDLPFRDDVAKPNRDNAIDVYIGDTPEDVIGDDVWAETFTRQPEPLTAEEKKAYLSKVTSG